METILLCTDGQTGKMYIQTAVIRYAPPPFENEKFEKGIKNILLGSKFFSLGVPLRVDPSKKRCCAGKQTRRFKIYLSCKNGGKINQVYPGPLKNPFTKKPDFKKCNFKTGQTVCY